MKERKILVEWRMSKKMREREGGRKNSLSATFYDFLLIFFPHSRESEKKTVENEGSLST